MAAEAHGLDLVRLVVLLAAAVVAVPLSKRLGLGSVLGYLAAGLVIGPFGLGLFTDPQSILHVAELGVVMFLFIVGLEMQPARLWKLRREILGLGVVQVGTCGALLTGVGMLIGFPPAVAFVAGMGFVLTSTAIVMQILNERGDLASPAGQRVVSILLLEDLAIVPLLVILTFLGPAASGAAGGMRWGAIAIALGAVAALVIVGRFLLNSMFRILAAARAREVMTAAALLVVLGAALAMQLSGLSMAMGAFLAGVLLSESTFRHELEADIEPFRGILLGLFFLSVGMALDLSVIVSNWLLIAVAVVAYMLAKALAIYAIARLFGSRHGEALDRGVLMAQGGEFAFVLYAAAAAAGIIDGRMNATLTATVILSMVITPLAMAALRRFAPAEEPSMDGIEVAGEMKGSVLLIGFGRFGQIVAQPLLLRGVDVTIIDNDVEMIQAAARFGFKVYYGDGSRLDILQAAGCAKMNAILVCINDPYAALRIVEHIKAQFPLTKILVRSYDREHTLALVQAGVDYEIRETFESALVFGENTLINIGLAEEDAAEVIAETRRRDRERLDLQIAEGLSAGIGLIKGNAPIPTPLAPPRRTGRALNDAAAAVMGRALTVVKTTRYGRRNGASG